ncbi:hypothetical protein VYU27_001946 [Nannochloropsis oceanica]
MNSEKLLFNYHDDAQVTEGDQILFRPPGWLNDRCINFYFRVLEHEEFQDRPDLLFMDPAVVSCMLIQCTDQGELEEVGEGLKLDRRSMVFIPVNDAEDFRSDCTHWSLLVYSAGNGSSAQPGKFFHLDSSGGRNEPAAKRTAAQFWRMVAGKEGGKEGGKVEAVRGCPQQVNGYDCGMYVLIMTKYLAHLYVTEGGSEEGRERSPKLNTTRLAARVTPDAIDEARRRIGLKIEQLAAAADGGVDGDSRD